MFVGDMLIHSKHARVRIFKLRFCLSAKAVRVIRQCTTKSDAVGERPGGGGAMETLLQPWKRSGETSGRSSRKEFWTFWLVNKVLMVLSGVLVWKLADAGPGHGLNPAQA